MSDIRAEREKWPLAVFRNVSTGSDPIYFTGKERFSTIFNEPRTGQLAVHGGSGGELSIFMQEIFENTSSKFLEDLKTYVVKSPAYTSFPATNIQRTLFDIDHLFVIGESWLEEAEKELDSICDIKHLEGAKKILRDVAMIIPTKPRISRSPEAGMAASFFLEDSAITILFESEIGLIVETHPSYSVQIMFDRPADNNKPMLKECRIRLQSFFL